MIEKGEGIEEWVKENGEDGMVREWLEGLKGRIGEGIGFEEVELKLGEGWIGRGVYWG